MQHEMRYLLLRKLLWVLPLVRGRAVLLLFTQGVQQGKEVVSLKKKYYMKNGLTICKNCSLKKEIIILALNSCFN